MRTLRIAALTFVVGAVMPVLPATAQPLGSFRWQLQPYCNIITLAVVQQGGQYQLDGTDDQCGAAQAAGVRGLAFQNPNGSIGFGLTIVTAPGGTPVHVDATIAVATLSGTWRDSAGNTGTFIFTPGAGTGGGPRPVPSGGIAPSSITAIQIAPAAVTSVQIANGTITTANLAAPPVAAFASGDQNVALTNVPATVRSVTMTIPAAGRVIVNASGFFNFGDATAGLMEIGRCAITTGTTLDTGHLIIASDGQAPVGINMFSHFGATRGFNVAAGSFTVNLVCDEFSGIVQVRDTSLTATFTGS
jgi:hypothetical protein